MDYIEETNSVVIFSKKVKLDVIVKKIGSLAGQQLYEFFSSRGVKMPRRLHVCALFKALNEPILNLKSNSYPKETFQRLEYYYAMSETHLLKFAKELFNETDFENYRMALAKLIITNYIALSLTDGEVNYLISLRKTKIEDFKTYSNYISSMSYEMESTFDGALRDVFFDNLVNTTSVKDMNEIGEKYGIPVLSRLKKEELLNYIVISKKLKEKDIDSIKDYTLKELEDFATINNIPMHASMSKKEVMDYFIFTSKQFLMPETSLKRVIVSSEYEPVKIHIDFPRVNFFDKNTADKVVYLIEEEIPPFVATKPEIIKKLSEEKQNEEIDIEEEDFVDSIEQHRIDLENKENDEDILEENQTEEVALEQKEEVLEDTAVEEQKEEVLEDIVKHIETEEVLEDAKTIEVVKEETVKITNENIEDIKIKETIDPIVESKKKSKKLLFILLGLGLVAVVVIVVLIILM